MNFLNVFYVAFVWFVKAINGLAPEYFNGLFDLKPPSYSNLRSDNDYLKVQVPSHLESIHCNVVKSWNSLPFSLRCSNSLPVFKKNLKTYFFQRAFDT